MYYSRKARLAIYAEGAFGTGQAKTADGVLRYGRNPVVAVIDSKQAGRTVEQASGIPSQVPIVADIAQALPHRPQALLLGTAWSEGRLPAQWKPDIMLALKSGLDVINGLHDFLSDDRDIAALASACGRLLIDVRRSPEHLPVASGKAAALSSFICLTVGSDGSVGKMTTALELHNLALARGYKSRFVATGQTGIMIEGEGIAIDRVAGDFMAGAAESLVAQAAADHDLIFVEGQGSLIHPGWSGVTLAILHGCCPQAMVLCHDAGRTRIGKGKLAFAIPKLSELVKLYEDMAGLIRPSRVLGVALNTAGLSEVEARRALASARAETGLPACDPLRFERSGLEALFAALLAFKEKLN